MKTNTAWYVGQYQNTEEENTLMEFYRIDFSHLKALEINIHQLNVNSDIEDFVKCYIISRQYMSILSFPIIGRIWSAGPYSS